MIVQRFYGPGLFGGKAMKHQNIWSALILHIGASFILATTAHADEVERLESEASRDDTSVSLACKKGDAPRIVEVGGYVGTNSYGAIDQDFYTGFATGSWCLNSKVRAKAELAATNVSDPLGDSQAYIGQFGLTFEPRERFLVTPFVFAGKEDLAFGDNQDVVGGGVSLYWTKPLDPTRAGSRDYLILDARPEYVSRQAATPDSFGVRTNSEAAVASAGAGFQKGIGNLNARTRLGYRYVDADAVTESVASLAVAVGLNDAKGGDKATAQIQYSRGNNDFEGVFLTLTFRNVG